MSRVAKELGAATMALYRHVSAKDELLAHMVDAAFAAAPAPPDSHETWRAGLTRWAFAHLTVLRRHRWLVRVPISGPPLMPNQVLWFEHGLQCLRATRLPEPEKPGVLLLVNGLYGTKPRSKPTSCRQHRRRVSRPKKPVRLTPACSATSPTPSAFRRSDAVLAARTFDPPGTTTDNVQFGLDCILDGIEVLVRSRA